MNVFVARQPIFDLRENVFAYELLFRDNMNNYYSYSDGDSATTKLISNSFLLFGIDQLTSGKLAFINFTAKTIKEGLPAALPKDQIFIELLEDIELDREMIDACKRLKELGYKLVLDDFIFKPDYENYIELASIIKIDYQKTTSNERQQLIKMVSAQWPKVKFLAEKIETKAEFNEAVKLGFKLFQGYYFCKPIMVSVKDIPYNKINLFKLTNQILNEHFCFEQIENIIKNDVSLTFKLLKYINSSFFGFKSKIVSIKHALALLGTNELKKWMLLMSLQAVGEDKPEELLTNSLLRARFGESIAKKTELQEDSSNIFFLGLFSFLDVFLGKPMNEILIDLPVTLQVKEALDGKQNSYRHILNLIIAYEKADWNLVSKYCKGIGLDEKDLLLMYVEAITFTQNITSTLDTEA